MMPWGRANGTTHAHCKERKVTCSKSMEDLCIFYVKESCEVHTDHGIPRDNVRMGHKVLDKCLVSGYDHRVPSDNV